MVKLILILLNLFLALQGVAQENRRATPWQEDLRFFQNTIHEDYPFLFVKTSPEAFDKEVETLHEEIPNLQDHEIIVGISRLVASFKYGRTHLNFWKKEVQFSQLTFDLYAFKGGHSIEYPSKLTENVESQGTGCSPQNASI